MVNFQRTPKPRNYLSRREQWRLLSLVLGLGLVLILMSEARDPKSWTWFFALGDAGGSPQGTSTAGEEPPIDTRLRQARSSEEIPGTFISPEPPEAGTDAAGRYFPGVEPRYFDSIRDDTKSRYVEREAWFHLMGILNKTDQARLQRASTGRVTFAQLFTQSDEYRGELVTVAGTIRRAHRLPAPENDYGIKEYYQTWLFPADNPSSPMVVYCLHLPEGFPTGMELAEEAEVAGFFFKRWAYLARDTFHTAPMLLARTVRWQKAPEVVARSSPDPGVWLLMILAAATFSILVAVYVHRRTRRTRADEPGQPPSFEWLRDVAAPADSGSPLERSNQSGPAE